MHLYGAWKAANAPLDEMILHSERQMTSAYVLPFPATRTSGRQC